MKFAKKSYSFNYSQSNLTSIVIFSDQGVFSYHINSLIKLYEFHVGHIYKFFKKIVLIYLIFAKKRQNTSILSNFCQVLLYLNVAPHPSVMFYVECVLIFM